MTFRKCFIFQVIIKYVRSVNILKKMKNKIAIWGASGHALVVSDIIRLLGEFDIAGYIDDANLGRMGGEFNGYPILGGKDELANLINNGVNSVIIAIGDCNVRANIAHYAESAGLKLATAIHPKAIIGTNVNIGAGSVVAAGAVINPNAEIGKNVIINTSAIVEHECIIGDGAHICPGVNLAGNVKIGNNSWVGIGSTIIENINIGHDVMIGAGSVVLRDIPNGSVAFGIPAAIRQKE